MAMLKHDSMSFVLTGWVLLAAFPGAPAWADSATVPDQPLLDQAIEQYLRSHSEVIEQALKSLEIKRQEDQKARIRQASRNTRTSYRSPNRGHVLQFNTES